MPKSRVTQFRNATTYLPRRERDRFDRATMIACLLGTLATNVLVTIPLLISLGTVSDTESAFFAGVLVCSSANLVALRVIWVFAQRVLRPWIFDREQRNNEIVPPVDDRSHTRA